MFQQQLTKFSQVPLPDKNRKCTDVLCTVIGAVFAITMFVLAFVLMNKQNYMKANFPTDSEHIPCAYGPNSQYAYVYFPDINNKNQRVCVSSCPLQGDRQIQCRPNKAVPSCLAVNIYNSQMGLERLGGFCVPTDSSALNILIKTSNLEEKWKFLNTYDIIKLSLALAAFIGLLWMIFVQFSPRHMSIVSLILGAIMLFTFGVVLLADGANGWEGVEAFRFIIGILLIFSAIFTAIFLFLYRRRIKLTGIFLDYGRQFLKTNPLNIIYIPIFILLTIGLIILCIFQHLAYLSNAQPSIQQNDIYLRSSNLVVLEILNIIEFIWGLQFLKDSFNFIISGNSAYWYIEEKQSFCYPPVSRLLKCHFGSVVGGSFLNAFFNIINFIYQTLRCYPEGPCSLFAPCCNVFSSLIGCFFDLIRTDAYAFINLTGIPYCNSARNCENLCNSTNLFVGGQSCIFFYRCCAHIFCVGLTAFISYWLMKSKIDGISLVSLLIIIIFGYCISTYFIDIHADAAEGIQTSFLLQEQLSSQKGMDTNQLKQQLRGMYQNNQDRTF